MSRLGFEKTIIKGQELNWITIRLLIPITEIAYFVGILEAYDNLFLVRTEDRHHGILRVWFHESAEADFDDISRELALEFPLKVLSREAGMTGLDDIYPQA